MNMDVFVAAFFLVTIATVSAISRQLRCLECNSKEKDPSGLETCSVGFAFSDLVKQAECPFGACYTILQKIQGVEVAYRGCTNSLKDMPYTLPEEDTYSWKGSDMYICYGDGCNALPAAASNGKQLDDHLKHPVDLKERGPINCYQCLNYDEEGKHYAHCPKDDGIGGDTVYSGSCNGTCFTRSYKDDAKRVARGCTDLQWGLPLPLPVDGCYDWNDQVWCICNSEKCNAKSLGKSSGEELDEHEVERLENYEETDGLNRCYECTNYDLEGNYYKQCPKSDRIRKAYFRVCNGTCFSRSYDYDDKKIARGCTDSQYGLPDPLPPDGCYKYYSEVWCVCSKTRCNGKALGTPKDIEFDAHIIKDDGGNGDGSGARDQSPATLLLFLALHGLNVLIGIVFNVY